MLERDTFKVTGVVHLPPMPGYEGSPGLAGVIDFALEEVRTLERAEFSAVLIENEGDRPHQLRVSDDYIDQFSRLIREVKAATKLPVGLEILYDMVGTVQCGINAGADFVRLDVFTDDTEVRWGLVKSCVGEISELRSAHPEAFPKLWADIHVKHGKNLSERTLVESTRLAVEHGADVVIVTGAATGERPARKDCEEMSASSAATPVFVGSGFATENAQELCEACDGAVVASSVQVNGRFNLERCRSLINAVRLWKRVAK